MTIDTAKIDRLAEQVLHALAYRKATEEAAVKAAAAAREAYRALNDYAALATPLGTDHKSVVAFALNRAQDRLNRLAEEARGIADEATADDNAKARAEDSDYRNNPPLTPAEE